MSVGHRHKSHHRMAAVHRSQGAAAHGTTVRSAHRNGWSEAGICKRRKRMHLCHSEHDSEDSLAGPVIPGAEGVGQVMWFKDLPGRIVANEYHSRPRDRRWHLDATTNWHVPSVKASGTTGERCSPSCHTKFRGVCRTRISASLVVYMRSLPPVHHALPTTEIIFPGEVSDSQRAPTHYRAGQQPGSQRPLEVGQISDHDCELQRHATPLTMAKPYPDMDIGGGFILEAPGARSPAPISPRIPAESATTTRRCLSRPCVPAT